MVKIIFFFYNLLNYEIKVKDLKIDLKKKLQYIIGCICKLNFKGDVI